MKLLVMPTYVDNIEEADGFIIGIDGLCVDVPMSVSVDEFVSILEKFPDKEAFVALNKNMHLEDLDYLKEVLFKLDQLNIQGVLYYDIAVVEFKKENKFSFDLVWAQEHMTTNAITSNYWYSFGAKYTLVSNEITMDEIETFKASAKGKLMVTLFGYLPMFVSKRHLVQNYLKTFGIEDDSNIHYLEKEGKTYPIIDSEFGTTAYSSSVLNGIEEVLKCREIGIDYIILNSMFLSKEAFREVVQLFRSVNLENVQEYSLKIDNMFPTDRGFLYKETVYKVKKND